MMCRPHRPVISALLIDISGTLHVGKTPTPKAVDAFHRLRESSIPFRLCSNSSKESSTDLAKRLESLGFEISFQSKKEDFVYPGSHNSQILWTSIAAAAQLVKNMNLEKPLLLLSESAASEVLSQLSPNGRSALESVDNCYDSVVVGLSPSSFDYGHLNEAFRVLKGEHKCKVHDQQATPSVPLIATHKAKYIQTDDGLSLGPGPFVTALETATGVTAHVVGKPSKAFFNMVIDDIKLSEPLSDPAKLGKGAATNDRGKIAVIGDDVEADLGGGAVELGLWRVLVKTGKYRPGDETRKGIVPPDEIYDSFSDFIDSLLK
ncbi:Haloacid dehalogenase-like hydrolase domain-containing protein 2 [Psilocybe cubensis]|uniref:Haloacid dehalogenase-like hydrolase domain-containing protein 2 n=2 Tax=Psilocybe cubensis TaxID=181762 RepID=A0ACB8H5R1_PSICU|nr:Haloacid dehalogenase-like hydrolase domain-containing protein 2 [Psilocybe cubensis]KAH9483333.1 Haloacid dehalogenase-like hydrolase domain-containing protein 2 [Psilocybe cubensis]